VSRCASCGAQIRWCRTEAGKQIPLDWEPRPDGNVHVYSGLAYVYGPGAAPLELHREHGEPLYVAHFSTCPNAGAHRKRKS
jgi:hypothetical protein